MPLADVAVGGLVLAHRRYPDAVLENSFADGQWCEECAHVVIIKVFSRGSGYSCVMLRRRSEG